MRVIRGAFIPLTILVTTRPGAQDDAPPGFAPLMSISFEGAADAAAEVAQVTPSGAEGLDVPEGRVGQGGDFLEGGCVTYQGLPCST